MKIIDWSALWLALTQFIVAIFLLLAAGADHAGYRLFGGMIFLLALVQIKQSMQGVVIDSDEVRFHRFMLRKRIAVGDIRAANCEFGVRFSPMLLFALAGGGSSRGRRGRKSGSLALRSYLVNLSGDFGSAQVRFYNKRWRDAFLMALRDRAPRCRITRWS